jgi:hypothetical protein
MGKILNLEIKEFTKGKYCNMPTFDVYIEFFGKKLKAKIEAESHFKAEQKVKERVNILKVEKHQEPKEDDTLNVLKDLFNIK